MCPNRRQPDSPYCADHAKPQRLLYERGRGSSAARGYGHNWRVIRLMVLRRDPLCVDPFAIGCHRASGHADHVVPKQHGGPDALENLQGLCDRCHSRKTLLEQSVTFSPYPDDHPSFFTISGKLITLWTATTAPPEAKPLRAWPGHVAKAAAGRGGRNL
jgi:5-methylcytosine-specific restriction enzyme A